MWCTFLIIELNNADMSISKSMFNSINYAEARAWQS